MIPEYTPIELDRIRGVIARLRYATAEESREIGQAVEAGACPPHLAPFWLSRNSDNPPGIGPSLFARLASDPLLPRYSIYGFFPELFERIYRQGQRPEVAFDGRTRGRVSLFRFDAGDGLVVKPLQSRNEGIIVRLAGEAGVGPRQVESLEGFLVEELVSGPSFTELPVESLEDSDIFAIGNRLGTMVATLHSLHIYYNDATLSDPDGRSHLLFPHFRPGDGNSARSCLLIDFGVSVLLDNFPDLEPEEVYNLVRTTPEFRLLSRMGLAGEEMGRFLSQYRQGLSSVSEEEILSRDLRFAEQGLRQAARMVGARITAPLWEGFQAGYG
ncbi:MAG: hypothetical protein OXI91_09400 [Chloroflexota bacterium]|nr:hypothetical protein [Chloroflexota bacterium]